MKKILTGLLAGAVMLGLGMLVGQVFQLIDPSLKTEYENPNLFRPWTDPLMLLYFVEPFVMGIIMAWLWDMTKSVIKGNTLLEKGIYFGLIYWVISIPGMIMSYSSFPLSVMLVFSWSFTGIVQTLCAGVLFSKMLKN